MAEEKKKRDGFGSKLGIIAAAAGSAIGLGNIYRFPCEVGENGGALVVAHRATRLGPSRRWRLGQSGLWSVIWAC